MTIDIDTIGPCIPGSIPTKRKLLLFQPLIGPYRVDLINDLTAAFETKVYLSKPICDGLAFQQQEIPNQLRFSPIHLPKNHLKRLNTIRKEIRRFKPDLILTCEFDVITLFCLVYRWFSRGSFKIISLSDDSYDMLTGNDSSNRHTFARKLLAKYLDEIVLVEPKAVEWYQEKYGIGFFFPIIRDEKVALQLYNEALPLINDTCEKYNLSGKYIFLYVGRLVTIKNVSLLIEAFSSFNESENKLVIVGNGPEMDHLKQQSKNLGLDVLFVGQQGGPSLYVWYLIADTFILPSIQEPFGAVTNEALLGGCYAIISDRAGSRCLVREGVNGFVFNPTNVEDLKLKMTMSKNLFPPYQRELQPRNSRMTYQYEDLFLNFCKRLYSI